MQMSRCGGGRRVQAAVAQRMLEARRATAEQTPRLPAASSGLPPWPPLRPPLPSHRSRSSGAWRPAPAGSAAGLASTTSLTSCGTTRGASSCCGHGLARMSAPTWMGRRTGTRPTRAAGSSSTTWASCKETLRYSPARGPTLLLPGLLPQLSASRGGRPVHLPSRRTQGQPPPSPRLPCLFSNRSLPPPTPSQELALPLQHLGTRLYLLLPPAQSLPPPLVSSAASAI